MKNYMFITGLFVAFGFMSCNSKPKENQEVKTESQKEVSSSESTDNQSSIEEIDKLRSEIESLKTNPIEISTTGQREKIRQKWSKIHFYVQNDVVVKVKTYPHSEISKRTEEFYANKDGLVLAVIEDNGDGPKGKEKKDIDKLYYFKNGKLIKESRTKEESEYTIKESDAEELVSEFKEYLEIYQKSKK